MRGDRPRMLEHSPSRKRFTPHARGSTSHPPTVPQYGRVYPACAGIDLEASDPSIGGGGLPRMRGDRPWEANAKALIEAFTPHARGST